MRAILTLCILVAGFTAASATPAQWKAEEWAKTDFSKTKVAWKEIKSGGVRKDDIPSIDNPRFITVAQTRHLADNAPVISLDINGDARAYPLQVLTHHEIVNDTVGGRPVAVTYCPLCNTAIVFDRRIAGKTLDFGTTGKLRNSDLVMYDRQTQSWWQQFTGEAIVGTLTGKALVFVAARLDSYKNFKTRFPNGKVLVPNKPWIRPYGANPYVGYDTRRAPYFSRCSGGPTSCKIPGDIPLMARVVVVRDGGTPKAVTLGLLRKMTRLKLGDVQLSWEKGQSSAVDTAIISRGRDVGTVTAQRMDKSGKAKDVPYEVTFAFAFHAFHPKLTIRYK